MVTSLRRSLSRWGSAGLRTPPPGRSQTVPGAVAAFEADMVLFGSRAPVARMLLTALAWAEGPGLPWDDIWVPVALALVPGGTGSQRITRRDVRWLLGAAVGHVATGAGPGGRTVYRVRDAGLRDHLRARTGEGGPPARGSGLADRAPSWQRRTWAQRSITGALLATVPAGPDGRDWSRAHPYLRTYLAHHAAAAGRSTFAGLIADMGFLAAADPRALVPLLSLRDPLARGTVRAYRRARPLLCDDPAANAAHLQEAARALPDAGISTPGGVHPRYRTAMASVRRDDSLLTLTGHTAMVYAVAFGTTAGGSLLLASGSDDGTIMIWDPLTGTPILEPITGHGDTETAVGVAPWGQTMKPSETYWNTGKEVEHLVFWTTRDGRLMLASAGCDRTVRIWDPLTGRPVGGPLTGHTGRLWHVCAGHAPDGRVLLASCGDDMTVRIWDAQAREPVGDPLTGHTDQVVMTAIGTTAAGRCLLASASSDCTVRLWDPLTGIPAVAPITGHDGPVFGVAFGTAPDGRVLLASASEDMTIRLWDTLTGEPVGGPLTGHTDRVDGLVFTTTSDGRWLLASSSRDQTMRLWDPLAGTPVGRPLTGHTSWVFSLAVGTAPDGLLLLASGSADTTVRIWDALAAAAPLEPASGHTRWVTSAAFGTAPDGRLVLAAGSGDGTVGRWDPLTGTPAGRLLPGAAPAGGSAPGGSTPGSSGSGGPHPEGTGPGRMCDVASVAFCTAPDGRLLLAAGYGDGTVMIADGVTGEPVTGPVAAGQGAIRAVALAAMPGGWPRLATSGTDGTVRLWDPLTGRPIGRPLTGHVGWVDALAFGTAPGGRPLLATAGGDAIIRLWDPLTGRPAATPIVRTGGGVRALALSTGRRGRPLLAAGGEDAAIRLWNPLTGRPAGPPLTGHTGWIAALAFTTAPGGRRVLVSGGGDRTVRVWHPARGTCLARLARGSAVRTVAAAGLILALGDDNGIAVIELDGRQLRPGRSRQPGAQSAARFLRAYLNPSNRAQSRR